MFAVVALLVAAGLAAAVGSAAVAVFAHGTFNERKTGMVKK